MNGFYQRLLHLVALIGSIETKNYLLSDRNRSIVIHANKHGHVLGNLGSNQGGLQQEREPQWSFENNTSLSVPYWNHD